MNTRTHGARIRDAYIFVSVKDALAGEETSTYPPPSSPFVPPSSARFQVPKLGARSTVDRTAQKWRGGSWV